MDRIVVFLERFLEIFGPDPVEFTESFSDKTVELRVRSFLRTTLDDHVAHFNLVVSGSGRGKQLTHLFAFWDIDFHELVNCFFKVELIISCRSIYTQ
jgi:hypothetical protein